MLSLAWGYGLHLGEDDLKAYALYVLILFGWKYRPARWHGHIRVLIWLAIRVIKWWWALENNFNIPAAGVDTSSQLSNPPEQLLRHAPFHPAQLYKTPIRPKPLAFNLCGAESLVLVHMNLDAITYCSFWNGHIWNWILQCLWNHCKTQIFYSILTFTCTAWRFWVFIMYCRGFE